MHCKGEGNHVNEDAACYTGYILGSLSSQPWDSSLEPLLLRIPRWSWEA